jgi:hypothetical protein
VRPRGNAFQDPVRDEEWPALLLNPLAQSLYWLRVVAADGPPPTLAHDLRRRDNFGAKRGPQLSATVDFLVATGPDRPTMWSLALIPTFLGTFRGLRDMSGRLWSDDRLPRPHASARCSWHGQQCT